MKVKYIFAAFLFVTSTLVLAARPEIEIKIINNLFHPSQVYVPANKKLKLIIFNEDNEPEEFDSFTLNREKVIFGNAKAVIYIGPLEVGEYPFFGQYHPTTAQGKVIALPPAKWEAMNAN